MWAGCLTCLLRNLYAKWKKNHRHALDVPLCDLQKFKSTRVCSWDALRISLRKPALLSEIRLHHDLANATQDWNLPVSRSTMPVRSLAKPVGPKCTLACVHVMVDFVWSTFQNMQHAFIASTGRSHNLGFSLQTPLDHLRLLAVLAMASLSFLNHLHEESSWPVLCRPWDGSALKKPI